MPYKVEDFNLLSQMPTDKLTDKCVFVRADFNVPFTDQNQVADFYRIKKTAPTIQKLLAANCKIVLATHIGDPEKKRYSTSLLVEALQQGFGHAVSFVPDFLGTEAVSAIKEMIPSQIILLENTRFFPYEKNPETLEMVELAKFTSEFDRYINESFGVDHRADTSLTILPNYIPSCIGINLENEIKYLSGVLYGAKKPLTFIVGGAKIESKMPVISAFLPIADTILVGGKLILEDTSALQGYSNVVVGVPTEATYDIDSATSKKFAEVVSKSKTIVWAGPMGYYENPEHEKGTTELINAIVHSSALKIAGGGDTVDALTKYNALDKFDFVSTGGGAMLSLLAGERLPGIDVLLLTNE